jgi:predicted DNA-binding protein (UPF0251 family)
MRELNHAFVVNRVKEVSTMGSQKINDRELLRLIDRQGMCQSEAAKALGVSRQAVSQRIQELRGKTTKVVVSKKIEEIVDRKIDAIEQLQKINQEANRLLDELDQNPELKLKIMAEIRGQLKLQLDLFEALFNLQAAEEFQNTVLKVIAEVDPNVRNEIIRRINEERSIRSAVRFSWTHFAMTTKAQPLHEWARTIKLDGRPFTFDRHEYLLTPYQDHHPFQVEQKAAQMGLTVKGMLRSLYLCRFGGIRGVLYLFPSRTDVLDFSKSRVSPLIGRTLTASGNGRTPDSAG